MKSRSWLMVAMSMAVVIILSAACGPDAYLGPPPCIPDLGQTTCLSCVLVTQGQGNEWPYEPEVSKKFCVCALCGYVEPEGAGGGSGGSGGKGETGEGGVGGSGGSGGAGGSGSPAQAVECKSEEYPMDYCSE